MAATAEADVHTLYVSSHRRVVVFEGLRHSLLLQHLECSGISDDIDCGDLCICICAVCVYGTTHCIADICGDEEVDGRKDGAEESVVEETSESNRS